jgi:multiple sugar transport system permease protein
MISEAPMAIRRSPVAVRPALWPLRSAAYAVLGLYAVVSGYPFVLMVSGAFKDVREVLDNPWPIPRRPTLETLRTTWDVLAFGDYVVNTIVIVVTSLMLILLVFPLAAYAFAVLRFPLRRILFGVFLSALFVPGVTLLLPIVLLDYRLGILGTPWGVVLPIVNGAGPLAILLLRSYFQAIPRELREAALLDGCGEFWVFWRIYYPLARPALVTVAMLNFVGIWNEYVLPSVTLNDPAQYTLPLGLQNLLSANVVNWNQVMAGSLIIVVPVILVFAFLQRYFVEGLRGSMKG